MKTKLISAALAAAMLVSCTCLCSAEDWADELLGSMTTTEKITQMIMPSLRYYSEDGQNKNMTELKGVMGGLIAKYPFSGVILYGQNMTGTEQTVRFVDEIQTANSKHNKGQLFIGADQEGGIVTRLNSGTQFAGNMALGATGSEEFAYETGGIIGAELMSAGINTDFAPVVDVNNNPSNPVIGVRSFSDDPETAARLGVSFMRGMMSSGVISTLKHFPGHGNTGTDSHTGLPCVNKSYDELRQCELVPFKACIDEGADMIMTAHIQFPNIEKGTYTSKADGSSIALPATLSKTIMTDILRGDMGFDGIVVTDAMEMDAISKHFDRFDAFKMAINAGVDILLGPGNLATEEDAAEFERLISRLAAAAESGEVSMENVNASVRRILALKEKKGLLGVYGCGDISDRIAAARAEVGSAANHIREWEITKRAITLLRNENNTLPLTRANEKTVILTAKPEGKTSAEFALQLLRDEGSLAGGSEVVIDSFRTTDDGGNTVLRSIDDLKGITADADNVIAITELGGRLGLNPANTNIAAGAQSALVDALIPAVHEHGGRFILLSSNLPYDAARYAGTDAIVLSWSYRTMSENPYYSSEEVAQYGPGIPAAVYLAFSPAEQMTGRLPVNIPAIDSEYNFTDTILYERGFGLGGRDPFLYCCVYYDAQGGLISVKKADASKTQSEAIAEARAEKPADAAGAKIYKWVDRDAPKAEIINVDLKN